MVLGESLSIMLELKVDISQLAKLKTAKKAVSRFENEAAQSFTAVTQGARQTGQSMRGLSQEARAARHSQVALKQVSIDTGRKGAQSMGLLRRAATRVAMGFGVAKAAAGNAASKVSQLSQGLQSAQMAMLNMMFTGLNLAFVFGALLAVSPRVRAGFSAIGASLRVVMQEAGKKLLPVMLDFAQALRNTDKGTRELIGNLTIFLAVAGAVMSLVGILGQFILFVFGGIVKLGRGFSALFNIMKMGAGKVGGFLGKLKPLAGLIKKGLVKALKLGSSFIKGFVGVLRSVAMFLKGALASAIRIVLMLFTKIGAVISRVIGVVGSILSGVVGTILAVIGALAAGIAAGIAVVKVFGKVVGAIVGVLAAVAAAIVAFVSGPILLIAGLVGVVIGVIFALRKEIVQLAKRGIKAFSNFVGNALKSLKNFANKARKRISKTMKAIVSFITKNLKQLKKRGQKLVGNILKAMKKVLKKQVSRLKTAFNKLPKHVKKRLEKLVSTVKSKARDIGDKIGAGIEKGIKAAQAGIRAAINAILPFGLTISKIQDFVSGARDRAQRAEEAASSSPDASVNDAVITDNGKVIETSPQDFLFATRNPEGLASGGAGDITVNFDNPQIDSEVDVDDLMDRVEDRLERNQRRRSNIL